MSSIFVDVQFIARRYVGFLDVRDLVGMLVQMHGYHGEAVRWGLLKSAPELLQHTVVEGEMMIFCTNTTCMVFSQRL